MILATWKAELEELLRACHKLDNPFSTDEREERMVYFLDDDDHFTIKIQSRGKKSRWTPGRVITNDMYRWGRLSAMDEHDKKIHCRCCSQIRNLTKELVFPLLAGSDRVYRIGPFENQLVDIQKENAQIAVKETEDGFDILSNIHKGNEGLEFVQKRDPLHYTVVEATEQEFEVVRPLLGKHFPLEARQMLKEVLPVLGKKISLSSSLLQEEEVAPIQGSGTLVLQIRPTGDQNFHLTISSQPYLEGKVRLSPGKGPEIYNDTTPDEKQVTVIRDLDAERSNLERLDIGLKKDCSLELGELLQLLEFVSSNKDHYVLEWPEGERLKVKKAPPMKSWAVNLKKRSGWFDVEGEVVVDEETVIDVLQLLNMLSQQPKTNYIRLDDQQYLLLTDALRKELDVLGMATVTENGNLRLPKANSLLLENGGHGIFDMESGNQVQQLIEQVQSSYDFTPRVPQKLNADLRPYQKEGFRWMVRLDKWGAGACLADDMGLGKTVQSIAFLLYKASDGPSLVVAPLSVIFNWREEIAKFAPSLNILTLNDLNTNERKNCVKTASAGDIVLVSYGVLSSITEVMVSKEWNVICLDEAHTIKNHETKMAGAVHQLQGKSRLALTGTPIQNHLGELWSLFRFINPGMLGSFKCFKQKFVTPIENGDQERQEWLRRIALPFILRRTKQEVVKELPAKVEQRYNVELSPAEMVSYEALRLEAQNVLKEEDKVNVNVLSYITKLRQAACSLSLLRPSPLEAVPSSKLEVLMNLLHDIRNSNNRVLIFSQFTSYLKLIKDRFDDEGLQYFYLDGSTPLKQREQLVNRFQGGESGIFIISLKAGGLGLNLTGANYVIHMDPWWNPAIEQQATDRAYRIGQQNKVTVYHLIATHTIEEKIYRLHQTKQQLSDAMLAGANVGHQLSVNDLWQLIS